MDAPPHGTSVHGSPEPSASRARQTSCCARPPALAEQHRLAERAFKRKLEERRNALRRCATLDVELALADECLSRERAGYQTNPSRGPEFILMLPMLVSGRPISWATDTSNLACGVLAGKLR